MLSDLRDLDRGKDITTMRLPCSNDLRIIIFPFSGIFSGSLLFVPLHLHVFSFYVFHLSLWLFPIFPERIFRVKLRFFASEGKFSHIFGLLHEIRQATDVNKWFGIINIMHFIIYSWGTNFFQKTNNISSTKPLNSSRKSSNIWPSTTSRSVFSATDIFRRSLASETAHDPALLCQRYTFRQYTPLHLEVLID